MADSFSHNHVDLAPYLNGAAEATLERLGYYCLTPRTLKHDPWLKDPLNVTNLKEDNCGIWHWKEDKAKIVPNLKDVRRKILYELQNTKYSGQQTRKLTLTTDMSIDIANQLRQLTGQLTPPTNIAD